jgi:hypothetical protein
MRYWQNRQWLEREYIANNRTTQDIGKEVNANPGTVYYWIKKVGLSPRKNYDINKARFDLLRDYKWMHEQYVVLKNSLKHIASSAGVSCLTVRRNLASHSIPINPVGVILSDVVFDRPKGADSPTWKGGKSRCVDCGAKLAARYKKLDPRCLQCRSLFYRKERHHSCNPDKTSRALTNAVRRSAQYKDWRRSVYERDCYTCVVCGVLGGRLHAHHLNGFAEFPDLRYDTSNGITLCEKDHLEFHRSYGMGNNTAAQFQLFLVETHRPNTTEMTY